MYIMLLTEEQVHAMLAAAREGAGAACYSGTQLGYPLVGTIVRVVSGGIPTVSLAFAPA
jgi:hypothetical protein